MTDSLKPSFLLKLKSLFTKEILNFSTKKNFTGKINFESPGARVVKGLIIGSGASLVIQYLGNKYLPSKISAKDISDAEKLKKALIATHKGKQKLLWEEIQRSQKDQDSLSSTIRNSIFNETKGSTSFLPTELISTLFLSKKERVLDSKTKWLDIQIRKYEDSLNHNQLVIYKNLYETEMKILSRQGILKSILYVGLPIIVYHLVGLSQKENIKEWEKAINK